MSFTSIICSVLLAGYVHAEEDTRILEAIASQESAGIKNDYAAVGDKGKARGRYGIHRSAWVQGSMQLLREGKQAYSYEQWKYPIAQDQTALAIIRHIRERLMANGQKPSPALIALVWNRGMRKALLTNFRLNGYAHRVQNLCDSADSNADGKFRKLPEAKPQAKTK
jgi:hypothetical protein